MTNNICQQTGSYISKFRLSPLDFNHRCACLQKDKLHRLKNIKMVSSFDTGILGVILKRNIGNSEGRFRRYFNI